MATPTQRPRAAPADLLSVQRLTETERFENLVSPRYASNQRLQDAFDNNKAIGFMESNHEAVRLVQQGLFDDGFPLPKSTKPTGEFDGIYGGETVSAVTAFQKKHSLLLKDGKTGRQVLRRLDELALGGTVGPDSTEEERRRALAIQTLVDQQKRLYDLIRAGLASVPAGTAPNRRDVLFRNSCQWIDRGKVELRVLVPTHDSASRATKPGAQTRTQQPGTLAFFDSGTSYPAVGGTYGLDPDPDEATHVVYAPRGYQGVTTNNRMELVDTASKNQDELTTLMIHETQHDADRTEGARPGQLQGPGRVEMFSGGRRDLQLEGHVNVYQSEFRAHWIERPEGDPLDIYGSSSAPAANARAVTFVDSSGAAHRANTNFKNLRQENVFFDLLKNQYPFDDPYTTNPQFKQMVDAYDVPAGVNLVNSVRVDDLLDSITACDTNMASPDPKIVATLSNANLLDASDRIFLRDVRLSKPFWDHAQKHLKATELARLRRAV